MIRRENQYSRSRILRQNVACRKVDSSSSSSSDWLFNDSTSDILILEILSVSRSDNCNNPIFTHQFYRPIDGVFDHRSASAKGHILFRAGGANTPLDQRSETGAFTSGQNNRPAFTCHTISNDLKNLVSVSRQLRG